MEQKPNFNKMEAYDTASAPLIIENPITLEIKRRKLLSKKREIEEKTQELSELIKKQEFINYVLGDFYAFCFHVMGFRDLYEPLHRWLCDEVSSAENNRKLVLVPRGHFKTTIASICYPVWLLCKNPSERIILASSISDKAEECLEEIVQRVSQSDFQSLFGDKIPHPDNWIRARSDMVRIPRRGAVTGPTILCIGTDSAEVGRHCSRFIIDDMVGKEEVNSPNQRDKIWNWLGRQLAVLDPGSELLVIGTPWHADDPYARIHRLKNWKIVRKSYKEDGKYIFPTRFNDEVIAGIRQIMDEYTFACFYELTPVSENINPFVIKRFEFVDHENIEYESDKWTYILVDPAVSIEEYSCPSGIVVADAVRTSQGVKFIIREAISQKLHPDQLVDLIFSLVKENKPRSVVIESEAQQKTFSYWIKREQISKKLPFIIEEVKSPRGMNKYTRILGLQPYFHNHAYVVSTKCAGYDDLMTEFSTYPKGKTDDLICALALAPPVVTFPPKKTIISKQDIPKQSRLLMDLVSKSIKHRRGRMPRVNFR